MLKLQLDKLKDLLSYIDGELRDELLLCTLYERPTPKLFA